MLRLDVITSAFFYYTFYRKDFTRNLKTLGSYAWRTIKFILLGLCLILPQQVFSLPHILPQNFSPLATNILTWGLLLLGYALVIVIFNWQFKKDQPNTDKIFQKLSNQDINAIITGFITLFIIKIIYGMFMSQFGQTQNDQALQQMFKLSTNAALMMFLMTAIFAPLCEELLFRGIFMRYFFPKNTVLAIFFSGLVFGMLHFHLGDIFWTLLLYCTLGWVLSYYYKKTGKLLVSIMIHFLNNILPALFMLFSALFTK